MCTPEEKIAKLDSLNEETPKASVESDQQKLEESQQVADKKRKESMKTGEYDSDLSQTEADDTLSACDKISAMSAKQKHVGISKSESTSAQLQSSEHKASSFSEGSSSEHSGLKSSQQHDLKPEGKGTPGRNQLV